MEGVACMLKMDAKFFGIFCAKMGYCTFWGKKFGALLQKSVTPLYQSVSPSVAPYSRPLSSTYLITSHTLLYTTAQTTNYSFTRLKWRMTQPGIELELANSICIRLWSYPFDQIGNYEAGI